MYFVKTIETSRQGIMVRITLKCLFTIDIIKHLKYTMKTSIQAHITESKD